MSDDPKPQRRSWALDITPLRDSPAYLRMWTGGVIGGIGAQLTIVAVGIHIYERTQSTFAVSLVGIFAFVPMIVVGLFGSTLVDAFDRRTVLIWAASVSWVTGAGIAALAWSGIESLVPLYVLTTISAASGTLVGTARFAILPRLLPREQLPAGAALSGISAGLQATVGPALAGILIGLVGFAWTYSLDVLLYSAAFLGIVTLPPIKPLAGERISLGPRSVIVGLRALASTPGLRSPILLHIVAMVFGRPQVLFPAVAATIVGGGPIVVGVLAASAAVGILASSAISGRITQITRHGVAVGWATVGFGSAILGFGLVILVAGTSSAFRWPVLIVACLLLFLSGVADNIAGIFRTTMQHRESPDAVRGRIQGLTTIVLTAGPRAGDAFVGTLSVVALWAGPLVGGVVIMAVAAGMSLRDRGLREYRGAV